MVSECAVLRAPRNWVAAALIAGIGVYRRYISVLLPPCCRYTPTCSQYAIDSIRKYGPLVGSWRALCRLLRCHPFHPGGYDPA